MKKLKVLIAIVVLFIFSKAYAFEGYVLYPMHGSTIFPVTDVNVKLSEINVVMKESTVISRFMLENLNNEGLNLKVAFPILSNCINNCTEQPDDFKVTINGKDIKTAITEIDENFFERIKGKIPSEKAKHFRSSKEKAIVWDISLKSKEKKAIICTYPLKWYFEPPQEILIFDLAPGVLWRGNIDKVYFKLTLPQRVIDAIESGMATVSIEPETHFKRNKNFVEWKFNNLNLKLKNKGRINRIGVFVWYTGPGE